MTALRKKYIRKPFVAKQNTQHSKKKFQVNEDESAWGGFLVDADAVAALPFFDRAIKATTRDDPDIVSEAWD